MPEQFSDELRALRERAYGPAADIHGDPAALSRLRELEELSRAQSQAAPTTPNRTFPTLSAMPADGVAPVPVDAAEPVGLGSTGGTAAVASADIGEATSTWDADPERERSPGRAAASTAAPLDHDPVYAPADGIPPGVDAERADRESGGESPSSAAAEGKPAPWWRRRVRLVWAGSLVLTALVAVAVTLWAVQDKDQVAVLHVAEETEWPEMVLGDPPPDARVFDTYLGLVVVMMPQSLGAGDSIDCLYVLDRGNRGVMSTIGCAAGAFAPTAALSVSDQAPEELRDRYADGTALQFVLNGDDVLVYANEP